MEQPAFRPDLVVRVIEPDHVFLFSEHQQFVLIGAAYRAVAPLIDGSRTVPEIMEVAGRYVSAPQALFAVQQLAQKGYLVEGGDVDVGRAALWQTQGVPSGTAADRLGSTLVELRTAGDVAVEPLRNSLSAGDLTVMSGRPGAGIQSGGAGPDSRSASAIAVVVTEDYLHPDLAAVAEEMAETERAWLLAKPVGAVSWLGPIFEPGEGACWHCLRTRLEGNRQPERYVARARELSWVPQRSHVSAPAPARAASQALHAVLEQWAVAGQPPDSMRSTIHTHDWATWEHQRHVVSRRPQCPSCGDPGLSDPQRPPTPVLLRSRPKRFTADGGHRTVRPEATLQAMSPHISPITGVVSSLVRKEPPEQTLTFSYASGHDFPQSGSDLEKLRGNMRYRSGGKGRTDTQARTSAVCEAVERWSGIWRGDEVTVRGSARDLGNRALALEDILLFSEQQYRNRHEWNSSCSPTHFHTVPEPLDPAVELDWTPAWSLHGSVHKLIPSAYCWYGHPEGKLFFCATDANGTSAGNEIEEAILQGLMELIERDAVAMWWYNRASRPPLDLDSFGDPYYDQLRDYYADIGRELWVLDLTHDLGIPVFAGVSARTDGSPEDIITSFGAHWDPRIALSRAVTEVNQFLPALCRRNPDGSTAYAYDDPDAIRWWSQARLESEPYLRADTGAAATQLSDFDGLPRHEDIRDDVQECLNVLATADLEALVIDQSRPDVDLHVVRTVVPGLRHFWRRLGPGRLYDVPVRLGWLDRRVDEDNLNPTSMFF